MPNHVQRDAVPVKDPISPLLTIGFPVTQRLDRPARSRRVVGSNPIWNSDLLYN